MFFSLYGKTPDVGLYANTQAIKYSSVFQYQDEKQGDSLCALKNWYQEEFDPVTEKKFRQDLMEELLFDNGWTFLDVEQQVDSPWIMIDRDEQHAGATKEQVRSTLEEGKLPVTADQAKSIKRALGTGRMSNIRIHKMNNGNIHVACERPGHTSGFQRMSFKIATNGDRLRVVQTAFDNNGKLVHQRPSAAKNNLYDVKK